MKTIQNAGLMAILGCLLFCLTGCEDPDEVARKNIPVTGEINANDVSFYINEREDASLRQSFMNGNGIMSVNGGTLKISSSHTHTTYAETQDQVQFESGDFQYVFENGDIIFGYYSGCGILCPENVCCDLQFQITGGTGEYSRATGGLTAVMVKNGSDRSPGLVLNLTGTICKLIDTESGK